MAKQPKNVNIVTDEDNAIDNANAGPFKMEKGTIKDTGREPEPQFVNLVDAPAQVEEVSVSHEYSEKERKEGDPPLAITMTVQRMTVAASAEENA